VRYGGVEVDERLLDRLMLWGWAWEEALQIAREEAFEVTVGGLTWDWLPGLVEGNGVCYHSG
jgi:hypothetical protein